jgi:protein-S-isoprenylcysteine O-methyltransferase Ste14
VNTALLLPLIRAIQLLFAVVWNGASLNSVRALQIVGCFWIVLGVYWAVSALRQKPTKKEEHFIERLRHFVPVMVAFSHRAVRHPIYTGLLLAIMGTVLIVGEFRALLAFAIVLASLYLKARKEDAWLAREFGETFEGHAKQTGMFLPRFS